MAGRPNKVGLDYFELDCHMDDSVKLVQAEFGLKGFAVIVKLYQKTYGGFGYYCEWNDDVLLLFMSENGLSSDNKNTINEIVSACIRRNIFSENLYKKYGILSSSGVQKRYLNATAKRDSVELKKEYLLISIPENLKNVVINSIYGGRNSISDIGNTQSRVKKSKEEKRIYYPLDAELDAAFAEYVIMRKQIKKPMTDRAVTLAMKKLQDLATPLPGDSMDNALAVQILNQSVMNSWQGLFPLKEAQQTKMQKQNEPVKPKKNAFQNFNQREYDFAELERQLIKR